MASKSTSRPQILNQKFWQNFAKNYWERKALVLRNVKSRLLEMTDQEIFNLLVLYADQCREQNDPTGFKFFINGLKTDAEDVLQVLPEKDDKTLLGYHARMKALFSDYCLVCDELLQVNREKQDLLNEFTQALYKHVGFPNRFSEMGLYLGNYRKTPFGVHVDSCGVFSFPVVGVKKFRLWTPAFVEKNPVLDRAFRYDKYKKNSQLLEAYPGDMTYWPSSAWHIAESDGSFSATWSLGVWVDQTHKDVFSDSLKGLLDHKMGARGAKVTTPFRQLHKTNGEVDTLPPAFRDSIKSLLSLTPKELHDSFLQVWMKHISSQGFKTMPQARVQLSRKALVKLRSPSSLILWQQPKTSKSVYFSFGGTLVEGLKSGGLLKLVKALNAGEFCQVGDDLQGPELKALQALADAGALEKWTGSGQTR